MSNGNGTRDVFKFVIGLTQAILVPVLIYLGNTVIVTSRDLAELRAEVRAGTSGRYRDTDALRDHATAQAKHDALIARVERLEVRTAELEIIWRRPGKP